MSLRLAASGLERNGYAMCNLLFLTPGQDHWISPHSHHAALWGKQFLSNQHFLTDLKSFGVFAVNIKAVTRTKMKIIKNRNLCKYF